MRKHYGWRCGGCRRTLPTLAPIGDRRATCLRCSVSLRHAAWGRLDAVRPGPHP